MAPHFRLRGWIRRSPPHSPPLSVSPYSQTYDVSLPEMEPHFRFYYDCLMRPNARSLMGALGRIEPLAYKVGEGWGGWGGGEGGRGRV